MKLNTNILKQNKMELILKEKSVYGNIMIYPNCEKSIIFSNLIGKKTFTKFDIEKMEKLGYLINIISL